MKKLVLLLTIFLAGQIYSQDILSSYITTKKISTNTYSFSITVFVEASLNLARPTVTVNFGDGDSTVFNLVSSSTSSNVALKTYSGTHTYASGGVYQVWSLSGLRVPNIKNITSSQNQNMATIARIYNNNFIQYNSAPVISQLPINLSSSGNQVIYNPGFSDPDGDSLSYSLENCYGSNYYIPGNANLDPVTGTFQFSDSIGLYAFSIKTTEWRKNTSNLYSVVGTTQMDFTINMSNNIGIEEQARKIKNLFVYPNPATNTLIIPVNECKNCFIEIYNSLGEKILQTNYSDKITISNLPPGLYFITLSDKYNSKTCKFIKD